MRQAAPARPRITCEPSHVYACRARPSDNGRPLRSRPRPRSPVRMRITSSTVEMKILPSPMRPVRAAFMIASTARSTTRVLADHLDLHLGQEIHHIFGAAIELGMALLPAEALGFDHGDALQADFVQRLLHLVQLERLDDRFDLLHLVHARRRAGRPPLVFVRPAQSRASQWAGAQQALHAPCQRAIRRFRLRMIARSRRSTTAALPVCHVTACLRQFVGRLAAAFATARISLPFDREDCIAVKPANTLLDQHRHHDLHRHVGAGRAAWRDQSRPGLSRHRRPGGCGAAPRPTRCWTGATSIRR